MLRWRGCRKRTGNKFVSYTKNIRSYVMYKEREREALVVIGKRSIFSFVSFFFQIFVV